MKCQKCGTNEANTHFVQNINGKSTELWLCSDCAEELGIGGMFSGFGGFGAFDPFSAFESMFGDFFGGMGSLGSMLSSAGFKSSGALKAPDKCPLCGSTFEDIVKRGKAGCPECYEHFADRLSPSIERLHGTRSHSGAQPERPAAPRRDKVISPDDPNAARLAELRRQLNEAVAAEEYEKAAQIHNQIKKLEA